MIDTHLEALAEYERSVAPAYELIRRARARLIERLQGVAGEPIPGLHAWQRIADPTEPNQAEIAVSVVEHPGLGGGSPPLLDAPAPESTPAAMVGEDAHASGEAARSGQASPISDAAPEASIPSDAATPAAVSSPPGGSPSAATRQPGSARRRGAIVTSSVGTPTPASPSELVTCPDCEKQVKAQGLGTHRRQAHSPRSTTLTQGPVALETSKPKAGDGRKIDEDCPNGCGRHFTWKPALASHLRHCEGPGGGPEPIVVVDFDTAEDAAREPWIPKPEGVGSSGPVTFGGRERWLCDRCQAPFPSKDSRDRHQATHPPIPDVAPVGGQRRRGEPTAHASWRASEASASNGARGLGQ